VSAKLFKGFFDRSPAGHIVTNRRPEDTHCGGLVFPSVVAKPARQRQPMSFPAGVGSDGVEKGRQFSHCSDTLLNNGRRCGLMVAVQLCESTVEKLADALGVSVKDLL
jgi:hypothetical protein